MTSPADNITVGHKNLLYGGAMVQGRLLDLTLGIGTISLIRLLLPFCITKGSVH